MDLVAGPKLLTQQSHRNLRNGQGVKSVSAFPRGRGRVGVLPGKGGVEVVDREAHGAQAVIRPRVDHE